ncbi:MAG: T9SS type A sorting domain-containing protein [Candidatus Cloacimonetes bacterium]|nr:T9SS type A sorting domain-containing protein [Candidatus Cloacimonadota bacterium]
MKKHWLIILALMLITSVFAYEVVAYHEDFESNADGWIHYDGAESPNQWHVYDVGGTQGNVWWMGDPDLASGHDIGGYLSHQYLVLDTPARTLTASNATLTFKYRLGLEEPAVHEEYDGWDSANIRISTDGGTTWTVIAGTPAYDFANSYAFGSEHGEGLGVPGWGGIVTTWTTATFNLSAYVGQSVKIRFAFASDPAYDTTNNAALFGFMVDDISFGGYSNNGVDDGEMVASSMVPLGGDLWHLVTNATAPSPTHVMQNQNDQGSYNTNMLNYLVSPSITLPSSGDIRADFMIMGYFDDTSPQSNLADLDYWGWEISPDNGTTWRAMSNPYGSATGNNYVYIDAPDVWASMVDSYSLNGYISDYAGETVKFRWYFKSDDDTPIGTGIMIDDFKIFNDVFIAPPTDLTAEVSGNSVTLAWEAPGGGGGGGEEGWLTYSGAPGNNSIGTGGVADFDCAHKYDAMGETNSIYPYVGMNITKIKFFPAEANCEYSVRVWTGAAGNLVVDQVVTNPTIGAWNEITLATPYTIPPNTSLMAGYRCNTQTGHPAGVDAGPALDGYGNMMRWQGSWTTLLNVAATLDYNWTIEVYVADANGREYVLGELPQNEQFAVGELGVNSVRMSRATGYRIYRDGVMIDSVAEDVLTYTDNGVEGGMHSYYVTAMYDNNESPATNTVTIFILPPHLCESYHDDGSAEMGLSVGSSRQMAVYYENSHSVILNYAKVFVHTPSTSSIIVRVYNDDGADGMPNTMITQVQYPAANVVQGWNYIAFPTPVLIQSGDYYLAIMETPNASQIGVDTSSNGFSYTNLGAGWAAYTNGEIMIRSIEEPIMANDDDVVVPLTLAISNYPNPFNPTTTISYSVPTSGMTSVKIYNLKGQMINTLVNQEMASGKHSVVWNGTDAKGKNVASGIYFMKVENAGKSVHRKMLLSK